MKKDKELKQLLNELRKGQELYFDPSRSSWIKCLEYILDENR